MYLRTRRVQAHRTSATPRRWRRWLAVGSVAVAALAATAVAPQLVPPDSPPPTSDSATPLPQTQYLLNLAAPAIAAAPASTPVPTLVPIPTATPATVIDTAFLQSVQADLATRWVKNDRDTPLRSGPDPAAITFTTLPQWTLLRVTDSQPNWLKVYYSGDGNTRQPGPGWVAAADAGPVATPTEWLTTASTIPLWTDATGSTRRENLTPHTLMEVLTTGASIQGNRIHVRLPGDGRFVDPAEGWVDAASLAHAAQPSVGQIPWAYPADLTADIRLPVRYRTQMDGSDFAEANCGPTSLGMAFEAFGINLTPKAIRSQVMVTQEGDPDDVDNGSFIWSLDRVARQDGLRTYGLYEADGSTYHQWSTDDVKAQLQQGRPVILQVRYRYLPERQDSLYYGDHYIIVTGLVGANFLYDDPIGTTTEGPGFDRVMTPAQLQRAMNASDQTYAFTGFALSKAS